MQKDYPELEAFGDDLYRCVKCGSCRSVCPVFAEIGRESAVARGKLALIENLAEGNVVMSNRFEEILSLCVGCSACAENCSNGVRAGEIIMAARAAIVAGKGLSLGKRLTIRRILKSARMMPRIFKIGSLVQGLICKRIPRESGLHLRFALPYLDQKRFIPPVARRFFLEHHGGEVVTDRGVERIGLFVGCVTNYLFPSIGEATVNLLKERGTSLVSPRDQGCCGLPAFGVGDIETFKSLALRNIEAIGKSGVDKVVVPCSSCAYVLKKLYPKIFPEDERWKRISPYVMEVSQYLSSLDWAKRESAFNQGNIKVTWHDPCHLNRELGIKMEPRELLKSIPQVELVEMADPSRCCGLGGSFNLTQYDLSLKIAERKMEDVRATGAEIVVTSCTGCILQLKDAVHQKGMNVEVLHLVEALQRYR